MAQAAPDSKRYPLKIENVGEDDYVLMSRGHHHPDAFMEAVRREGYDWQLGYPGWLYWHATPRDGYLAWYTECPATTRGCFPVTVVQESCRELSYEALKGMTAAQRERAHLDLAESLANHGHHPDEPEPDGERGYDWL